MNKLIIALTAATLAVGAYEHANAAKSMNDDGKNNLPAVQTPAKPQKAKPFLLPSSARTIRENALQQRNQSPGPSGIIAPMF